MRKLTPEDILEIRRRSRELPRILAEQFAVSANYIRHIIRGHSPVVKLSSVRLLEHLNNEPI
jgi:hypothetical protein